MDIHFTVGQKLYVGCEKLSQLGAFCLSNANAEYLGVLDQILIVLLDVISEYLSVKRTILNALDKGMRIICSPDTLYGCRHLIR